MKSLRPLLATLTLFFTFATAARAGTWSVAPWTGDGSTYLAAGPTAWAYHFGSATAATVNGVSVPGLVGDPAVANQFALTGVINVLNPDANHLTTAGGNGSAVMAGSYIYGGVPGVLELQGLTPGQGYTVSFFSVGSGGLGRRLVTFSADNSLLVDASLFGTADGLRVDYTFTATAATQTVTLNPLDALHTWHLYALALRTESAPLVVANANDAGPGSLRQAVATAATTAGRRTITFAAALAAQTINLASEIALASDVTLDASALAGGLTVHGGPGNNRIFNLSSPGVNVALNGLTLTSGNLPGSVGGAIRNFQGTLALTRCTLRGNSAGINGGAVENDGGVLTLLECTVASNTATSGGGGALHNLNFGTVLAERCTFSANTATGGNGGALDNTAGTLELLQCTVAGNQAANGGGGGIYNGGTLRLTHCTVVGNVGGAGGGLYHAAGTLTLAWNLLALNTSAAGPDLNRIGPVTTVGANLIVAATGAGGVTGPSALTTVPTLGKLAGNGGPTLTRALLAGSPAGIGAATGSLFVTDQRGYYFGGTGPDLGAFELGGRPPVASVSVNPEFVLGGVSATGTVTLVSAAPAGGSVVPLSSSSVTASVPASVTVAAGATTATFTISTTAVVDYVSATIIATGSQTAKFTILPPPPVVTTNADQGPGSLRRALANAAAIPGANTITFASGFTGPINLSSEIAINDADGVTLDATAVPGGVTINGGGPLGNFRLEVARGTGLTLRGLTLANGGGRQFSIDAVGAIANNGTLVLAQCTLSGNYAATYGRAIYNAGTLALTQCTLAGHTATDFGGAIYNIGRLALTQCTLSGNSASSSGGAIYNAGTLALTQCTLSGNTAAFEGGAIYNAGTLALTNCIVAGNTAGSPAHGHDIDNIRQSTVNRGGANLVQSLVNEAGATDSGPAAITNAPLLAPLADNGGPTKTMALLPGSPALDAVPLAAIVAGLTTDQRGFPRSRNVTGVTPALPDIGAYEAQAAPLALGFNFNGASPRNLLATDRAGAPEFAQAHWNNLIGNSSVVQTARTLSGGATATVRTWKDAPNVWAVDFGTPTTADQKLMWGYLDGTGAANTGTNLHEAQNQPFFALADLPAILTLGGYRVVVYADTDATDGRTGEYWLTTFADPANITGTSDLSPHLFLKDTANFSGTYTRVPATSTTRDGAAAGNYLVFEHQTQPAFILRTEDNPSLRSVINAVQVVRNELLVVTTAADENDPVGTLGAGLSLREAVALAPDGASIVFDRALSGQTITLSAALKDIALTKSVTIDASSLPAGLTLSGGGSTRIFYVNTGTTCSLKNLTLTGGNGTGASRSNFGGAIANNGTLTLTHCTLSGNSARDGGGIYNLQGTLTLTHCTLSGNSATNGYGGAIANNGTLTLAHCTLSGNSATSGSGGAIGNNRTLTLTHCTLSGNSASRGGGIYNLEGTLTLTNSIVAGEIYNESSPIISTYTRVGVNLVQSVLNYGTVNESGPAALTAAPLLAPLGNYGGPTPTMALLPGSPARNAAVGSTITSDQRGFPIVGVPDLGAYEAGTLNNFDAWIWETLPATATAVQHLATADFDGDGVSNADEFAAGTNPASDKSVLRLLVTRSGGNLVVTFPSVTGHSYTLAQADTLAGPWTDSGRPALAGNGGIGTFTVAAPAANVPARFYRVMVGP